tara:strand:- start:427 stop:1263 length:837 start_codon:yes stop_codon:yes gene_type:complete
MPFIGQEPITGAFHKLDAITTSSTNTYNLLLNGGAYSPASANHLMVSLNGVIQSPGSSFTISGSQITFVPSSGTLSSSDSIDFIMAYGDVLNIGTPSDGSVNTNQLATNAVTSAKIADANITTAKLTGETIIQVKTAVDTSIRSTTSQTFVTASNTAQVTITPRSTSSRMLVMCSGCITPTDGDDAFHTTIFRDSTNLGNSTNGLQSGNSVPGIVLTFHPFCMTVLDSPNTTSSITYGLQFRNRNQDSDGFAEVVLGRNLAGSSDPMPTHMTVMELAD